MRIHLFLVWETHLFTNGKSNYRILLWKKKELLLLLQPKEQAGTDPADNFVLEVSY